MYLAPNYGKIQKEIETYEKYNGKFTSETAEAFLEDYREILSSDGTKEFESENAHLKMLTDILPDIGFDIVFGYYEQWLITLVDSINQMQYIPFLSQLYSSCYINSIIFGKEPGNSNVHKPWSIISAAP